MEEKEEYKGETGQFLITESNPKLFGTWGRPNVVFSDEGEEVGRFEYGDGEWSFTGNVSLSAELFVKEVLGKINGK